MRYLHVFAMVLATASVAFAEDLKQKVSYTTVAVPVDRALREIAAATKVKLEAATAVRREIVVINVRDVVLNDLMKRIATATSCAWLKSDDGTYKLYRSLETERAEEEKEIERRVALIGKAVEELNKSVKEHPVLDAKTAYDLVNSPVRKTTNPDGSVSEESMPQTTQPANRAIAKLLTMVSPRDLATMDQGSRVVYSTRPNRMQLPMGRDAIAVIDTMVAEQAVWAEAYRRKAAESAKGGDAPNNVFYPGENNAAIQGTPVKALVRIQLQRDLSGYEVRLELLDAQGKQLFSGGDTLGLDSDASQRLEDLMQSQPPTDDVDIELSHDSQEILAFFRGLMKTMQGGGSAKDLPADVISKLRSPDKYDPLGFIHSEALMAAANAADSNLVADVPDSMMAVENFIMPGQKLTVKGFIKALSTADIVNIESKDGWMVVKPARPFLERSRRAGRPELSQLIESAHANGTVPLNDLAAYALTNEPLEHNEVTQLYAVLFLPGAGMGMWTDMSGPSDNWEMLRLYGSLTASQRQTLASGRRLPLGTLLPAQTDHVFRLTYYGDEMGSHLTVQRPESADRQTPFPMWDVQGDEPTEVLPAGLPPSGVITVKVATDAVAKDAGPRQPTFQLFGGLRPEELAMYRGLKDDPNMAATFGSLFPDLTKFRMGTRTTYSFQFQFLPAVSMVQSLIDTQIDPDGPVLSFEQLPADYKKKVDAAAGQFKLGDPSTAGGGEPVKP